MPRCSGMLATATVVEVDPTTCSLHLPMSIDVGHLNVAIALPPATHGSCNSLGCFVAIEQGAEGWAMVGGNIVLPAGACQPRSDGRPSVIAVTTACSTAKAGTPICGAWSSAPTPIDKPPPPVAVGDACDGPSSQVCGNCGKQTRVCQNGTWSG